jgi:hypothetical protein
MRGVYPAWAYLMPVASYRHNISVVLVAAAVGAISSAVVVLSLVDKPWNATEIASTSVHVIVTRAPAATHRTVVQDRSQFEQTLQPKFEQPPQSVPDVTGSDRPAAVADAEPHIATPGVGGGQATRPLRRVDLRCGGGFTA